MYYISVFDYNDFIQHDILQRLVNCQTPLLKHIHGGMVSPMDELMPPKLQETSID